MRFVELRKLPERLTNLLHTPLDGFTLLPLALLSKVYSTHPLPLLLPRSFRIVWLLEEIGCPYEIKFYKRTKNKLAPKELLDIHPLGKSPVITDGDRTVAETGTLLMPG